MKVDAYNYEDYKFVIDLKAPNLSIAKKSQKAISKGNFPDYPTYERATRLGASKFSELQLIDEYTAPDFKTAKQIQKSGFRDFEEFQNATKIGANSSEDYEFVKRLSAPDFKTAKTMEKKNFS